MYFKESERLVSENPSLKELIEKVDKQLSAFDANSIAKAEDIAVFLRVDPNQIRAILEKFCQQDLLEELKAVECASCHALTQYNNYQDTIVAEDKSFCSSCTKQLGESPLIRIIFRLSQKTIQELKPRTKSDIPPSHIVLLLHGIRTDGAWQEKAAAELNKLSGVEAIPIGYEYFDAFKFWCPFTRSRVIAKALGKIRHAKTLYPNAEFSVIAHSFGTYSVFKMLEKNPELQFKHVILCGSIISSDYPWAVVQPRITGKVINECGSKDIWPVAAKSCSWGYGATGTFGFKSPGIIDRFHNLDHSGYFNKEFIKMFWVPFIKKGAVINSEWNTERPPSPSTINLLSIAPIQWLIVTITVYSILWKTGITP